MRYAPLGECRRDLKWICAGLGTAELAVSVGILSLPQDTVSPTMGPQRDQTIINTVNADL